MSSLSVLAGTWPGLPWSMPWDSGTPTSQEQAQGKVALKELLRWRIATLAEDLRDEVVSWNVATVTAAAATGGNGHKDAPAAQAATCVVACLLDQGANDVGAPLA